MKRLIDCVIECVNPCKVSDRHSYTVCKCAPNSAHGDLIKGEHEAHFFHFEPVTGREQTGLPVTAVSTLNVVCCTEKAFFVLTITWKWISEVWAKLSLQNLNWGFYRSLATWWRMDCFMWALVKEMRPLQYWLRKGYQYSCKSPPRFQLFCKIYSCPCVIM